MEYPHQKILAGYGFEQLITTKGETWILSVINLKENEKRWYVRLSINCKNRELTEDEYKAMTCEIVKVKADGDTWVYLYSGLNIFSDAQFAEKLLWNVRIKPKSYFKPAESF